MNGSKNDKTPRTSPSLNDAVLWYMSEVTHRVVAQTGNPSDRYHLGRLIHQGLRDAPDFILHIDGATGASENFGSVLKRSIQCANGLRKLSVKTGDVMILMAPNHLDLIIPFYAALYLGLTVAPIDKSLRVDELVDAFFINNPKIIFCQSERLSDVVEATNKAGIQAALITFDEGDGGLSFTSFLDGYGNDVSVDEFRPSNFDPANTISFILSTSGKTGKPKAAAVSHKSFLMSQPYLFMRYTEFPTPTRLAFIVSPLQWLSAIMHHILSPILRYTNLQSSLPMTKQHTHDLINKYRPTFMVISPAMLTSLIKPGDREKCDFSCFETIIIGGGAAHKNLISEAKKLTPTTEVLGLYGMSEASSSVFQHNGSPVESSTGTRTRLYQYRLMDPVTGDEVRQPYVRGELQFRSPPPFRGYFNNHEASKETVNEHWLKTGDILYRDENWNFFFVDRLEHMLKYKHHQISPVEIEGMIRRHPSVLDVAVVGVPDAECGDLPVACVVPKPGQIIRADEIKKMVKENLRDSKQLRVGVIVLSELPTTATTRLDRQKLKAIALNVNTETLLAARSPLSNTVPQLSPK